MGRSADSRFAGSGRSTMAIVLPLRFRGGIGGRALVRHEVELRHDHGLHFERERRTRGLLVPVIRSAQALGLKAFSDEAKRLAGGAIDGTIAPDFLSGGTFTVSNIGSFGIETFTPVINLPQTAILGVGAITPRPVVAADGTIGVEQRLNLSLTIDHQVIDGADGARFLRDLVAAIENIDVTVLA